MAADTHLHISIGPVQGFVAQSRRTRDLWSSSYLLSFLAAHAIHGAERAGGRLIRPRLDADPLLGWVRDRGGPLPVIGSVPNVFTLGVAEGDVASVARAAQEAFGTAWRRVTGAVWDAFVRRVVPLGHETEAIWERQIAGFWEILWIAGPADSTGLLVRRKRFRTHCPPEEGGDMGLLMNDLQELSGYVRSTERARQDAFWQKLRTGAGLNDLDIGERERLSAVGLIKRLYPKVAAVALGGELDSDVKRWPSTVDVAATSWRAQLVAVGRPCTAQYAQAARAAVAPGALQPAQDFTRLDAGWFHRGFLADEHQVQSEHQAELRKRLEAVEAVCSADGQPVGAAPIYYAMLLADGDRLGEMVSRHGGAVSKVLAEFTGQVQATVRDHRGVTVYAGGDDVLALLPVDRALACADALQHAYAAAFERKFGKAHGGSLSASVVFAHARAPLGFVLRESHRLLDHVAKDQNGRSSLVVTILRGGQVASQWVTAWLRRGEEGLQGAAALLESAAQELRTREISRSVLQHLRRDLGLLCGASWHVPGAVAALAPGMEAEPLVRAALEHSALHRAGDGGAAADSARLAKVLARLLPLARAQRAEAGQTGPDRGGAKVGRAQDGRAASAAALVQPVAERRLSIDGLMVAAFLAGGGREEAHQ